MFYALKHDTIENATLDKDRTSLDKDRPGLAKDRPSLDQNKNLNEIRPIGSNKAEKHRFELDCLRPEAWYH